VASNPYRAPNAEVADIPRKRAQRYFQALLAFVAGVVITPCILYSAAYILAGDLVTAPTTISFWAVTLIGAGCASAIVYPFRNISAWLTVILGPLVVLTSFVMYIVWFDSGPK